MARRMEKFPRPNPVADVPTRKVVKRLPDYLRLQERLRFGPEPADRSGRTSIPASAEEKLGRLAAGGASEPPSLARAAPRASIYYPTPKRGTHRRVDAEPPESDPADLELSGREDLNLRPFGPETGWARSQAVLILRKPAKPLQAGRATESSRPRVSQRMREILLPIYYPNPGPRLARRARAWARQATRCPGGATWRPERRHAYGQRLRRRTWCRTGAGGTAC